MSENERFLLEVREEDIPWHALTGPYERADSFPQWIAALTSLDNAVAEEVTRNIAMNFEHQGTLWPVTPFAMVLLRRVLSEAVTAGNVPVILRVLQLYRAVYDIEYAIWDEPPQPLGRFADMLLPQYLPRETTVDGDEDDEDDIFEEYYDNLDEDFFAGCFYYTWYVLHYSMQNDFPRAAKLGDAAVTEALAGFSGEGQAFLDNLFQ